MRIVSVRQLVTTITYTRDFSYINPDGSDSGAGCRFDSDKDGNVDLSALQPAGLANYMSALTGVNWHIVGAQYRCATVKDADGDDHDTYIPLYCTGRWEMQTVRDEGVSENVHEYRQPAVGECQCGEHVHLTGFTNTCDKCSRDYNMSGQLLAGREQWGEETGESVSDILSVDATPASGWDAYEPNTYAGT